MEIVGRNITPGREHQVSASNMTHCRAATGSCCRNRKRLPKDDGHSLIQYQLRFCFPSDSLDSVYEAPPPPHTSVRRDQRSLSTRSLTQGDVILSSATALARVLTGPLTVDRFNSVVIRH
ncbi:hypothetical protein AAFF_G00279940 [Aldrovandia affinis]|uniref:Uncharacterized protein n=1 Tax=Aldrovandia affinis TaxID=143900 RepID=A0AAD7SRG2_9TELE|nr:hypothetical protein AAFF_G00279940 [Aldrovandia affinis]